MIKVLHIARPVAGVGVYISLLTKHIDNHQFINVVICNKEDKNIEILDSSGHKIKHYHSSIKREINIVVDFKALKSIFKIIKEVKPDIIHCHSAKSGILGRLAGFFFNIKTIYTPHAYSYLSAESKKKKYILKLIEKCFGKTKSYTLACSLSEYKRAVNDLKIKQDKVFLWNNSIENNIKIKSSNYLDILPNDFICTIGRPSYQKNTMLLLESILLTQKQLKNIHLVILGVGFYSPELENIKDFINKNGLLENVTLIPWLTREETMSLLQKSLFYISTSRYEGLPYSVIEALALKKPCILTDVDGNNNLLKNNYNGFLVQSDPKEISIKIAHLFNNKELLLDMAKNAKAEFDEFYDIKKNIKALENLYLSIYNKDN